LKTYRIGAALAAAYLLVAAASFYFRILPVRPLFDGFAPPPPYRYVNPPAGFTNDAPPLPKTGEVKLTASGSEGTSVSTDDAQASLIMRIGAAPAKPGQTAVAVKITPLDPEALAPPPKDLVFDGNAYRFEAAYAPSKYPIILAQPVTVVLRYPISASKLLALIGASWSQLPTNNGGIQMSVYADVTSLGIFAAADPVGAASPSPKPSGMLGRLGSGPPITAGVLLLLAAILFIRGSAARRKGRGAQ
jgi:hypothetical protein